MTRTLAVLAAFGIALAAACSGPEKSETAETAAKPAGQPAAPPRQPADYTNLHLIAAMPDAAESVWVQRIYKLHGTNFGWLVDPKEWESAYTEDALGEDAGDLWSVAFVAAIRAGVVLWATGGSDFKSAQTEGVGDASLRYIVLTKGDLSALRAGLDAGTAAKGVTRSQGPDGMILYSGRSVLMSDTKHDVVLAMPDDHTLVLAPTTDEARAMCAALARPAAEAKVPARWAAVAQTMKLESPIVVLRTYERAREDDPSSPTSRRRGDKRADVTAFGAALETASRPTLKLTALAPDPAKAAAAYSDFLNDLSAIAAADGRFTAEYRRAGLSAPAEVYMIAMHLFGLDIVI